jgi:hypothetical protein
MGILKGRQFFSWEISPVLEEARSAVSAKVDDLLEYEPLPGDAMYATALVKLAALNVDANKRAETDSNSGEPAMPYRAISPFWQQVDAAISIMPTPEVLQAVAALPVDPSPPITSLSPTVVVSALAGLAVLGYLWTLRR